MRRSRSRSGNRLCLLGSRLPLLGCPVGCFSIAGGHSVSPSIACHQNRPSQKRAHSYDTKVEAGLSARRIVTFALRSNPPLYLLVAGLSKRSSCRDPACGSPAPPQKDDQHLNE